jgi:hypothetical protein
MKKVTMATIQEALEHNFHSLKYVTIVMKDGSASKCTKDEYDDSNVDYDNLKDGDDINFLRETEWEAIMWLGDEPEGMEKALILHDSGDNIISMDSCYRNNEESWESFKQETKLEYEPHTSWKMAIY